MRKTFVLAVLSVLALVMVHGSVFGQLREVYLDTDSSNAVNRISFISPNEGYVAFQKWIGHTTDSGRTYTKLSITPGNVNFNGFLVNYGFGFDIAGVKAFNASTLVAWGDYDLIPTILYSANGGATWIVTLYSQYSPGDFTGGMTDVVFPLNDNVGYAVDADRILKTTNGGLSWSLVAAKPHSYFDHLESVDDNTVFAMSTNAQTPTLFATTNGGLNWQPVPFPSVAGGVMAYTYFLTASTGWMSLYSYSTGYTEYFFRTTNGGVSWTLVNNPAATPFRCGKMHFTDVNTGYAVSGPFELYKTINGGASWERLPRDNPFTYLGFGLNDLQLYSPTQLWAGGGHGYLELTTNSGGTPIPTAFFTIDTTGENLTGTVNLDNFSNPAYQSKWYVNNTLIGTTYNASYTHVLSRFADTITLIVTSGGISDTVTKYQYFQVPNLPAISSFAPQGGGTGTYITINGSGLTNVNAVSFGGTPAASFTVVSDNLITAVVAAGSSGAVTVTDIHGSYSLPSFIFVPPPASPPPVISSIFPAAAPMGSTVTIQGSGFGASPSANGVFFGTIQATVQSASPTSIVCTVPPGASFGPVSVLNRSNALTGQSPEPFNVSFADSSNFTPASFLPVYSRTYPEYTYPNQVIGKDLDGDGKPDLVEDINILGNDSLIVYLNTTTGGTMSFGPATNVTVVGGAQIGRLGTKIEVNDIDGDGLPDVAFATNDAFVTVIRNTSTRGHLAFTAPSTVPTPGGTQATVITDLDNDGKNDIAVACFDNRFLAVARNTGAPGLIAFAATQYFTSGGNPNAIAAGDLDGDGKKDIVMLNFLYSDNSMSMVSCYRNTSTPGSISFAPRIDLSLQGYTTVGNALAIADYDGDGKPDLIVSNSGYFYIFLNTSTPGNLSFAPAVSVSFPYSSQGVSLSNYSGSSHPDAISGAFTNRDYYLIRNTSHPGVISNDKLQDFPGVYPYDPVLYFTNGTDFDMDGRTDIAITGTNDDGVVILKNEIGIPQPFQTCSTGTSTLASDVTGTAYQWQRNTGAGYVNITDNDTLSGSATATLTFNNTPAAWNGYQYRCRVDSFYSSIFRLTVQNTAVFPVTITASDSVTCYGTPVTFNATTTDSLSNYSYNWQINGISTNIGSPQFSTTTLQDSDKVQVLMWVNNVCGAYGSTSRAIQMKVTEIPDSITISAPVTTICGSDSVTFTATAINPGANPIYTWTLNNYTQPQTGPVFTFTGSAPGASNGANRIQATLTSSLACADPISPLSNTVQINLVPTGTISVQVNPLATTICKGSSAYFYPSTTINGQSGGNITYNWLINGVNTGITSSDLSTTALNNNDTVQVKVFSNTACLSPDSAISTPIVMTVTPLVTPAVIITPAGGLVCAGSNPVFTAQPTNGGTAPAYQWWVNGMAAGTDQPTYTMFQPVGGNSVTVTLTSNASCLSTDTVTSAPLVISINAPSVLITGDTTLSPGTSATISATATGTGDNPTYQWQDSTASHGWQSVPSSGSAINYTPVSGGAWLRCVLTDTAGCSATSNTLAFTLNGSTSGTTFWPNPVRSTLYIANADASDPFSALVLTDAVGNRVLTMLNLDGQNPIIVDVALLAKGIYFANAIRVSGKSSHFSFLKR